LARLQAAVKATLADPAYQAAVAKQGLTLKDWDADSYRRLIQSQIVKWKPIVKAAHLK
jgi:tripartite-type tricarboxylate transporter receptor subunit TctC